MEKKIDNWYASKNGHLVFGLLETVLAYAGISVALDTANMLIYFLSIVLTLGAIYHIVLFVKMQKASGAHGAKRSS